MNLALPFEADMSDTVFIPLVDPPLIGGIKPVVTDAALKFGCHHYDLIILQERIIGAHLRLGVSADMRDP